MSLNKVIAISGEPGLFSLVANKNSGLILENMESKRKKFYASRAYQFTPLESISIYTNDGDAVELTAVFKTIMEKEEEHPLIPFKSSPEELFNFFGKILPNYDTDKVYANDVKKVIKWYSFLKDRDLLSFEEEVEEKENEEA